MRHVEFLFLFCFACGSRALASTCALHFLSISSFHVSKLLSCCHALVHRAAGQAPRRQNRHLRVERRRSSLPSLHNDCESTPLIVPLGALAASIFECVRLSLCCCRRHTLQKLVEEVAVEDESFCAAREQASQKRHALACRGTERAFEMQADGVCVAERRRRSIRCVLRHNLCILEFKRARRLLLGAICSCCCISTLNFDHAKISICLAWQFA